jgi:transposase
MKTMSLDLRERIVAAYDAGKTTRQSVAERFRVSLGMVKKLLWQRKRTGDLRARHRFSGRKPMIVEAHRQRMRELLGRRPDMTLAELRSALGLNCTLPAIHYALVRMNLTYKKRHCAPANSSGRR